MVPTPRLTKRQKKGIAFRERKHVKGQDNQASTSEDKVHVSGREDKASTVSPQGPQVIQVSSKVCVGRREAGREGEEQVVVARKKRRQAGEEEKASVGGSDKPKPKRRKGSDGGSLPVVMEENVEEHVEAEDTETENERAKQRFILFLGNLKYTTTLEDIQEHFSTCVPPPTVRLLTPKSSAKSSTKSVMKSKGCAFLEFTHRGALQQGLKFHHSILDGRHVNVELTAGGGGKGLTRMKKLKQRNKELEEQRRKRQGSAVDAQSSSTQRFSATSGVEKTHTHKRTWTISDVEEESTHRGGKKRPRSSKKRESLVKDFRTGVNAIPVG